MTDVKRKFIGLLQVF